MKSFIRSLLIIGGMILFLKLCIIVSNHEMASTSSLKHKTTSTSTITVNVPANVHGT